MKLPSIKLTDYFKSLPTASAIGEQITEHQKQVEILNNEIAELEAIAQEAIADPKAYAEANNELSPRVTERQRLNLLITTLEKEYKSRTHEEGVASVQALIDKAEKEAQRVTDLIAEKFPIAEALLLMLAQEEVKAIDLIDKAKKIAGEFGLTCTAIQPMAKLSKVGHYKVLHKAIMLPTLSGDGYGVLPL